MSTRIREYLLASELPEAVRLLQQPETAAWLPAPRMPAAPAASVLVDLQRLNLAHVRAEEDGLHIGGQATLEAVATHPAAHALAGGILAHAARLAAHRGLRNLATLQGALSDPDGPPEILLALAALGATARVATAAGEQSAEVYLEQPMGSILVEVVVPPAGALRGALQRVARTPLDQAIVAAVAVADAEGVAVAVSPEAGAFAMLGTTLAGASLEAGDVAALIDSLLLSLADDVAPSGDYRGSAAYRSAMVQLLARRALTAVLAEGSAA